MLKRFVFLVLILIFTQALFAEAVDFIFMIDTSASMEPYFNDLIQYVITDIVNYYLAPGDRIHLLCFSSAPSLELVETISAQDSLDKILAELAFLKNKLIFGRYTDLLSAIDEVLKYTSSLPESTIKKILLLSDGIHDPPPHSLYSGMTLKQAQEKLQKDALKIISRKGWSVHVLKVSNQVNNPVTSPLVYKTGKSHSIEDVVLLSTAGDQSDKETPGSTIAQIVFTSQISKTTVPVVNGKTQIVNTGELLAAAKTKTAKTGAQALTKTNDAKTTALTVVTKTKAVKTKIIPTVTKTQITTSTRIPAIIETQLTNSETGKVIGDIKTDTPVLITVNETDGSTKAVNTPMNSFESPGKPLNTAQVHGSLLDDFCGFLNTVLYQYDPDNPLDICKLLSELSGNPRLIFPAHLGKKGNIFNVPFKITNYGQSKIVVVLTQIEYNGQNILYKSPVKLTVGPGKIKNLHAVIRLPEETVYGEQSITVNLVFNEDIKIAPVQGIISFNHTKNFMIVFFESLTSNVFIIILIIVCIVMLVLLFIFLRSRLGKIGASARFQPPPGLKMIHERGHGEWIEMKVSLQNPNIGFRNIHKIKELAYLSVGGKNSTYLLFLVSLPAHIADITYKNKSYIFTPRQAQFFPDLNGPLIDCLKKPIRVVSKGFEFTITFIPYVSLLDEINKLLNSLNYE